MTTKTDYENWNVLDKYDSMIVWGGYQQAWSNSDPWFIELQNFMSDKGMSL